MSLFGFMSRPRPEAEEAQPAEVAMRIPSPGIDSEDFEMEKGDDAMEPEDEERCAAASDLEGDVAMEPKEQENKDVEHEEENKEKLEEAGNPHRYYIHDEEVDEHRFKARFHTPSTSSAPYVQSDLSVFLRPPPAFEGIAAMEVGKAVDAKEAVKESEQIQQEVVNDGQSARVEHAPMMPYVAVIQVDGEVFTPGSLGQCVQVLNGPALASARSADIPAEMPAGAKVL